VVLTALQGKGLVRKEAFADLIYSLLFVFTGAHYLASLGLGYFVSRQK